MKNKGISLIVLVITIIVMIILATSIILSLNGSGVIDRANEGKFKNDLKVAQQELQSYKAERMLEGNFNEETLFADLTQLEYNDQKKTGNIKTVMPSMSDVLSGKIRVIAGSIQFIGSDDNQMNWAEQVGIYATNRKPGFYDNTIYSSEFGMSFINSGILTIPQSNPDVYNIGDNAYYKANITDLVIHNKVKSIGVSAFESNTTLKNVTFQTDILGNSDLRTIGNRAFYGCSNSSLTSIALPNGLTTIGSETFRNCSKVTNVTMPNTVTTIGTYAFYGCGNLTNITLSSEITVIPSYTFNACSKLNNITLPSKIKNIGSYAFNSCIGLTSITLPDSLTTISDNAFSNCTNLTEITIPKNVNSIGANAFYGCTNLSTILVDSNNQYLETDENGHILYNKGKTKIIAILSEAINGATTLNVPEGVTSISAGALSGRISLTTINLPKTFNAFDYRVFTGLTNLTTVNIDSSNANYTVSGGSIYTKGASGNPEKLIMYLGTGTSFTVPSTVNEIEGYAFSLKGASLTGTVDLSNTNITTITGYAFNGCRNITTIKLPSALTTLNSQAFSGCSNVISITPLLNVTKFNTYVFNGCTKLTNIAIGSGVTDIHALFAYNSAIVNIDTSLNDKYTTKDNCLLMNDEKTLVTVLGTLSSLTSLSVPDTVTTIGTYAVYNRTALKSVNIPSSVSRIDYQAFGACTTLPAITIPASVTTMDKTVFGSCYSLTRIFINKKYSSSGVGTIYTNEPYGCPYGLRAVVWSDK